MNLASRPWPPLLSRLRSICIPIESDAMESPHGGKKVSPCVFLPRVKPTTRCYLCGGLVVSGSNQHSFGTGKRMRFALKAGVLKKSPNYAEQFTSNEGRKLPQSANCCSLSTTKIIPAKEGISFVTALLRIWQFPGTPISRLAGLVFPRRQNGDLPVRRGSSIDPPQKTPARP